MIKRLEDAIGACERVQGFLKNIPIDTFLVLRSSFFVLRASCFVLRASLNQKQGTLQNNSSSNKVQGTKNQEHSPGLQNGKFWTVKDVSFELKRGECLDHSIALHV